MRTDMDSTKNKVILVVVLVIVIVALIAIFRSEKREIDTPAPELERAVLDEEKLLQSLTATGPSSFSPEEQSAMEASLTGSEEDAFTEEERANLTRSLSGQ
jgi:hypothetical protein